MLPGAWNDLTLLFLEKSGWCYILTPFSAGCLISVKDFITVWYKGNIELWAWSFLWGISGDHLYSPVISNQWAQEYSWQSMGRDFCTGAGERKRRMSCLQSSACEWSFLDFSLFLFVLWVSQAAAVPVGVLCWECVWLWFSVALLKWSFALTLTQTCSSCVPGRHTEEKCHGNFSLDLLALACGF